MIEESDIYRAVADERIRAHNKHFAHGGSVETKLWTDARWLPIIIEEIGECALELNELFIAGNIRKEETRLLLYKELVQVAAMVCAWADACTRE
jgi:hypothetical protein